VGVDAEHGTVVTAGGDGVMQGLAGFVAYFGMGLGFMLAYVVLYLYATPHRELALIRGDNLPAAVVLAGAVLGFALPLASALRIASGALDVAAWALVALLAQLTAYALVALLLKDFSKRINRGEMAAAVLAAVIHVSVGLLNSAAMNY
jgi:putative membrane protein